MIKNQLYRHAKIHIHKEIINKRTFDQTLDINTKKPKLTPIPNFVNKMDNPNQITVDKEILESIVHENNGSDILSSNVSSTNNKVLSVKMFSYFT